MALFLPLLLAGPLLMLATACVALWSYGPLGWLAAVLLVVGVLAVTWQACRFCLRWWRSTKAPVRGAVSAGGTGRASGAPPARRAGTWPG